MNLKLAQKILDNVLDKLTGELKSQIDLRNASPTMNVPINVSAIPEQDLELLQSIFHFYEELAETNANNQDVLLDSANARFHIGYLDKLMGNNQISPKKSHTISIRNALIIGNSQNKTPSSKETTSSYRKRVLL